MQGLGLQASMGSMGCVQQTLDEERSAVATFLFTACEVRPLQVSDTALSTWLSLGLPLEPLPLRTATGRVAVPHCC